MADLTYIIKITHKDKGIGFTIKQALQNAQRQETSPIQRVRFSGQPSSDRTEFEVTLDDTFFRELIINTIGSSGRMPQVVGAYCVEEIKLQTEEDSLMERLKETQRQYDISQRQLSALRDENVKLRQDLAKNKAEVRTPLECLFAYFETVTYSPEVLLEDAVDLDFARRVFSEDIENKFVNYANHVLGKDFSEEEVEKVLAYKLESSDEMDRLCLKYNIAKKELNFLGKIRSGETEIPETLREDYVNIIESKGHGVTVAEYESKVQEQETVKSTQEILRQLKSKYNLFSEQIDLLIQAGREVPIIFNFRESGLELYFPFNMRDVKAGFIDDLRKELETYFGGTAVEPLDNKLVAYQIKNGAELKEGVDRLVEDTPITLRVAGFNIITPYRLG